MYRRKMVTGILALTMAVICAACGNGSSNAEPAEAVASVGAESEEEKTGTEEQIEAEVQEQTTAEEPVVEGTEAAVEPEAETAAEENQDKNTLTSVELEKIVQQYDEVLSNYDLECYFGYNKPDDGWELEAGYDGRE